MYKVQHLYVDSTVGCYGMYKVTSHAIFHVKYACVPRAVDGIGTHNILPRMYLSYHLISFAMGS